jgi:hypothetical protein
VVLRLALLEARTGVAGERLLAGVRQTSLLEAI